MPALQQPTRARRASARKTISKAPKKHTPGSPPNICVVGTPEEVAFVLTEGGKAAAVHKALRLLKDIRAGSVTISPAVDYL